MMYSGFVPLKLSTFWDHININLAKLTNELFGAKYMETVKIKVCAQTYQTTAAVTCSH